MLHAETANGYVIGTIIVYVLLGVCVLIAALLLWLGPRMAAIIPVLCGIAIYGVFVWAAWPPYAMQYHTYQPTTITVKQISSRFIGDGNSVNQRIAVVGTDNRIYGCDDTRCTTLSPGQIVTLMCTQEWQGNAVPGYVCNWGRLGNNG